MNSHVFITRLNKYVEKYRNFLNEKTTNSLTGEKYWTHKELRGAVLSLLNFKKYLFTFEQNKNIPKTSNSLEGHFSHIKDVVDIHRGLSRPHKERVLNSLLLASIFFSSSFEIIPASFSSFSISALFFSNMAR